jgi:hypothetical protein
MLVSFRIKGSHILHNLVDYQFNNILIGSDIPNYLPGVILH